MRIDSSVVAMQSQHSYSAYAEHTAASLVTSSDDAVILDFSSESKSLMEQLQEKKEKIQQNDKDRENENAVRNFKTYADQLGETGWNVDSFANMKSQQIETLKRILAMLNHMRGKDGKIRPLDDIADEMQKINSGSQPQEGFTLSGLTGAGLSLQSGSGSGGRTVWTKTTVESAFVAETENTAFQAQGIANTADGRQISFGVSVEMSRAFAAQYETLSQQDYVLTDPLVINLDAQTASVTDQKFMFDLDSDGKEEEISFAGQGSGFLALDKNHDGKINNGNELFGTKSGDGFKDLAKYDEDQDGWIDEDDTVFNDLKIWTKDENGRDQLISLKDANVGAIYLGKANTQFSLNDEKNQTNGMIQSTGIYLKETGEVGTVQHVDLVI